MLLVYTKTNTASLLKISNPKPQFNQHPQPQFNRYAQPKLNRYTISFCKSYAFRIYNSKSNPKSTNLQCKPDTNGLLP
jgi:hypothetical protein